MKHPVPHELYRQWARYEPDRCRHDPDGWAVYAKGGWNDIVARNITLTTLLEALPTHDWGYAFSEPPVDGALVQMHVYETGREILELGVVPLANMLPEVAYIKLGWALGVHPDDPAAAKALMQTPIAGEMTAREPHDGYLILQGGVPEVEEFLKGVWR